MTKKYSLTKTTKEWCGKTLFQIKAEISFGTVVKGELGGYIEKEENLSQVSGDARVSGDAQVFGDAWVSGGAQVFGDAWVSGDARVYGNARVFGNARVSGDAQVSGGAQVSGDARVSGDAQVFGDAWVSGGAQVSGDAWVFGDAWVSGNARVSGGAQVSAKASFTKGWFIGGDDSGKITDITDKAGSTYWKNQYVLGDYEITPIEEVKEEVKDELAVGSEVELSCGGKVYKATINNIK